MINDEIHGTQRPDPEKVRCRNCLYRDQTTVNAGGKKIPVGVTRGTCLVFNKPGNRKPMTVLFDNADCPMYEKDEDA